MSRRVFVLACALGMVVRLALVVTTFGSNDAVFWARWEQVVRERGIGGAYAYGPMVNHPPPALALARLVGVAASASGLRFGDVFRVIQVLADGLSAWALYRIGRAKSRQAAQRLALFVLLSPAAAFVSGFHCNSDPLMIALVIVAAMLAIEKRPAAAGVALALAAGIKVVPILLAPIFAAALTRRLRFAATFAAAVSAIYFPAMARGGSAAIRNLFAYAGGLPYEWGLTGVAFAASHVFRSLEEPLLAAMRLYQTHGRWVVYAGLLAVIALAFRRPRGEPLNYTGLLIFTLFALAPGFGVQYMAWLIPLLPFALPWRGAVALNAAASAFLFVTYTVWSGGWPWWFGDLGRPGPYRFLPAVAGCLMWALVCVGLLYQLARPRSAFAAQERALGAREEPLYGP